MRTKPLNPDPLIQYRLTEERAYQLARERNDVLLDHAIGAMSTTVNTMILKQRDALEALIKLCEHG